MLSGLAEARKKKTPETKTESKPKTRTNTSVAFDKKNDFSSLLKTPKKKLRLLLQLVLLAPVVVVLISLSLALVVAPALVALLIGVVVPPVNKARSNPQLKSQRGKSGTYGRPMPSNPAVGYSKPKRSDFKSREAFLKALEVYMRRKNRGTDAARSTGKGKAKTASDGRQYGG